MDVKMSLALVAAIAAAVGVPAAKAQPSQVYTVSDSVSAELSTFGGEASCDSCGDYCGGGCVTDDPWRMFPEVGNGWTATGWVAMTYLFKICGPLYAIRRDLRRISAGEWSARCHTRTSHDSMVHAKESCGTDHVVESGASETKPGSNPFHFE